MVYTFKSLQCVYCRSMYMEIRDMGVPVINIKLVDGGRIGGSEIVRNPQEAISVIALELADQVREIVYVINLDSGGHVLAVYQAGLGTTNYAMVTGKEIFQSAILTNASSVIIIHNHPGQDPAPSRADVMLTTIMRNLGMHLGIEIADHIIVAGGDPDNIVSFRENNFFVNKKDDSKKTSRRHKRVGCRRK